MKNPILAHSQRIVLPILLATSLTYGTVSHASQKKSRNKEEINQVEESSKGYDFTLVRKDMEKHRDVSKGLRAFIASHDEPYTDTLQTFEQIFLVGLGKELRDNGCTNESQVANHPLYANMIEQIGKTFELREAINSSKLDNSYICDELESALVKNLRKSRDLFFFLERNPGGREDFVQAEYEAVSTRIYQRQKTIIENALLKKGIDPSSSPIYQLAEDKFSLAREQLSLQRKENLIVGKNGLLADSLGDLIADQFGALSAAKKVLLAPDVSNASVTNTYPVDLKQYLTRNIEHFILNHVSTLSSQVSSGAIKPTLYRDYSFDPTNTLENVAKGIVSLPYCKTTLPAGTWNIDVNSSSNSYTMGVTFKRALLAEENTVAIPLISYNKNNSLGFDFFSQQSLDDADIKLKAFRPQLEAGIRNPFEPSASVSKTGYTNEQLNLKTAYSH